MASLNKRPAASLHRDIALLGERYGSRTVVALPADYSAINRVARVRCDCGRLAVMRVYDVGRNPKCRTCGNRECATKHGWSKAPMFKRWRQMVDRCHSPGNAAFKDYGARGIRVCYRWRRGEHGLSGFECWLADLGQPPFFGAQMDRIDNDGHYAPGNVRWSDPVQQANNRRSNRKVEINGNVVPLSRAPRAAGLSLKRVNARLRKGWPVERALNEPSRHKKAA